MSTITNANVSRSLPAHRLHALQSSGESAAQADAIGEMLADMHDSAQAKPGFMTTGEASQFRLLAAAFVALKRGSILDGLDFLARHAPMSPVTDLHARRVSSRGERAYLPRMSGEPSAPRASRAQCESAGPQASGPSAEGTSSAPRGAENVRQAQSGLPGEEADGFKSAQQFYTKAFSGMDGASAAKFYRAEALKTHPDKTKGNEERFKGLQDAYDGVKQAQAKAAAAASEA